MDEYTADVFANRDDPLPVVTLSTDTSVQEESSSKLDRSKEKLKKKLSTAENADGSQDGSDDRQGSHKLSLQERLLSKYAFSSHVGMPCTNFDRLLEQVIPKDVGDQETEYSADKRSSKRVARPSFSLPLMTNNFRRFNARSVD
jgi:hypothetical protein